MKLRSKQREQHPSETIKLCDINDPQDNDISSSAIKFGANNTKIEYLNLIKYSRIVQEELFTNDIFSRITTQLEKTQELLNISESSINTFSRLLNDDEVEIKNDEFIELMKLSDIFKVDRLFKILQVYLQNHENEVDFLVNLKITEEKYNDTDLYVNNQISTEIDIPSSVTSIGWDTHFLIVLHC